MMRMSKNLVKTAIVLAPTVWAPAVKAAVLKVAVVLVVVQAAVVGHPDQDWMNLLNHLSEVNRNRRKAERQIT